MALPIRGGQAHVLHAGALGNLPRLERIQTVELLAFVLQRGEEGDERARFEHWWVPVMEVVWEGE